MKINKLKLGITIVFSIVVIIIITISISYYNFTKLEVYVRAENGDITSKGAIHYTFDGGLTSDFSGGELLADKVIGRIKGVSYITSYITGPRVISLKGHDSKKTVMLSGIMQQIILTSNK